MPCFLCSQNGPEAAEIFWRDPLHEKQGILGPTEVQASVTTTLIVPEISYPSLHLSW